MAIPFKITSVRPPETYEYVVPNKGSTMACVIQYSLWGLQYQEFCPNCEPCSKLTAHKRTHMCVRYINALYIATRREFKLVAVSGNRDTHETFEET